MRIRNIGLLIRMLIRFALSWLLCLSHSGTADHWYRFQRIFPHIGPEFLSISDKSLSNKNSSDKIFVIKSKFRQFCPTNIFVRRTLSKALCRPNSCTCSIFDKNKQRRIRKFLTSTCRNINVITFDKTFAKKPTANVRISSKFIEFETISWKGFRDCK